MEQEQLDVLNKEQQEAVEYTEGPLLILAGAGSGKTKVLTHRTAYLIDQMGVNPWNILAITFTNKAADEMRERIDNLVGFGSESIWVATFHSTCVRILRRFINRIGYENNFSIYDRDDQKNVMKEVCKRLQIDTKQYKENMFINAISACKDELITPEKFAEKASWDFTKQKQAQVYRAYQETLKNNNALDFDDLIMKCVELLQTDQEVREHYQERFRYVMVDEYQDTNTAQFHLVRLLSGKYRNLCVVGDDDQSIYKFRGANIQNILSFEEQYPDARVIKLEQNYRSTQNILDAANAVISNNEGRRAKKLWTQKHAGAKITFRQFESAYEEAEYIAIEISSRVRHKEYKYGDCAVLYRTNAQSRLLEEKMVSLNIPYRVIGGVNFYSRREVKDILAYLKTIDNGSDDLAVRRIINVPKRGIGGTTITRIQDYAAEQDISFFEACRQVDSIGTIARASSKITSFVTFIRQMRTLLPEVGIKKMTELLLEQTGYVMALKAENDEKADERIENIDEFLSKIADYEESTDQPTLGEFLDQVSLVADIDNLEEDQDYVALMTLHSAKGLEFPCVYMAGMEDGLFPSYQAITSDDLSDLEEERRLCYVGITRAREVLTMTCAKTRMFRGELRYNAVSRFMQEIPPELLTGNGNRRRKKPQKQTETSVGYDRNSEIRGSGGGLYGKAGESFRSGGQGSAGDGTRSRRGGASTKAREIMRAKTSYSSKASPSRNFGSGSALQDPGYQVGDRVSHPKFGEGTVTAMVPGGRDYEVTVQFDGVGVKKMFAMFAKMHKI